MPSESSVKVAVRCRPLIGAAEHLMGSTEILKCCENTGQVTLENKVFHFDHVYGAASSQRHVFDTAVISLVENFISGQNAAIFVHGETGSGKSHTMGITEEQQDAIGRKADLIEDEECGMIPRILHQIFARQSLNGPDTELMVSFIETHKENVFDILSAKKTKITIRENLREITLPGLTEVKVSCLQDALKSLVDGARARETGPTAANAKSSRSHAIFYVTRTVKAGSAPIINRFYLVDLAGSESVKRAKTQGERFKEGVGINQGLLSLGRVIRSLGHSDKAKGYVPYRESTLTRLLQNCLQSNCHTLLIACISPLDLDIVETNITLKFALGASAVKIKYLLPEAGEPMSARKAINFCKIGSAVKTKRSAAFKTPGNPAKRPTAATNPTTVNPSRGPVTMSLDFSNCEQDETIISSNFLQDFSPAPIPAVDSNGSPTTEIPSGCVTSSKPDFVFRKPETPQSKIQFGNGTLSPYVTRMCSSMAAVLDRMVDRLATGPRLLNTPDRTRIVSSVVDELNQTRLSLTQPLRDRSNSNNSIAFGASHYAESEDDNVSPLSAPSNSFIPGDFRRRRSQMRDVPSTPSNLTIRRSTRLSLALAAQTEPTVARATRRSCRSTLVDLPLSTSSITVNPNNRRRTVVASTNSENMRPMVIPSPSSNQRQHTDNILHVLNTGSVKKLQQLPTVGPKSALVIHNFVSLAGNLDKISDLKNVPGLPKTFPNRFKVANMCT